MLLTERSAMLQLLGTVGTTVNSSGFAVFFRNGSSSNVPKALVDLIASSRAVVEYKFVGNPLEANGQYDYQYTRVRSLLPVGGYGMKRTVPLDGVQKDLYAVYPEYTRFTPVTQAQNKTPQQILAQCAACQDVVGGIAPAWTTGDIVEYDFGRTLRFRQVWSSSTAAANSFDVLAQDLTTGDWNKVTMSAGTMALGLDVTARRIRIVAKTTTSEFVYYTFFAERGSEFVEAAITHAVLVPLTVGVPNGSASYLIQVPDDYYGLVADIGTDLTVNLAKIGQFSTVCGPDLNIRLVDNFVGNA